MKASAPRLPTQRLTSASRRSGILPAPRPRSSPPPAWASDARSAMVTKGERVPLTRATPSTSSRSRRGGPRPGSRTTRLDRVAPRRRNGRLGIFLFDDGKARFVPLDAALEGQPAVVDLPAETLLIDQGRESLNEGDAVVDAGNGPQAAAGAGAASPDDSR